MLARTTPALLCLVALASAGAAPSNPWPTQHHDERNSGRSPMVLPRNNGALCGQAFFVSLPPAQACSCGATISVSDHFH